MAWSIHTRQSVVVGILLAIFIAITGASIDLANQSVARESTKSYLRGQLYSLVSAASIDENKRVRVKASIDPRFNSIDSGLYSVVVSPTGKVVWQSNSSVTLNFDNIAAVSSPDEQLFVTIELTDSILDESRNIIDTPVSVNHIVYTVPLGSMGEQYSFHVAEEVAEHQSRLNLFRFTLWASLLTLSALLMFGLGVAIRWSLSPLRQIADRVEEVNRGEKMRIEGVQVKEISGLTNRLNALLDSERIRRQRFKNSLSDLAHSLKTPLAVMQSEYDSGRDPDQKTLIDQIRRMREIVDYQLRRASMSGKTENFDRISLTKIINQLSDTLKKVYHAKNVEFILELPEARYYPIDKGDAMEIIGNVMDNACKYGHSKVKVSMKTKPSPFGSGRALLISIEDNGKGIGQQARNKIMQRGYRIDETSDTHGQGIGLALVSDILDSYGGVMRIEDSKLGGACFDLYFPLTD